MSEFDDLMGEMGVPVMKDLLGESVILRGPYRDDLTVTDAYISSIVGQVADEQYGQDADCSRTIAFNPAELSELADWSYVEINQEEWGLVHPPLHQSANLVQFRITRRSAMEQRRPGYLAGRS